MNQTIPNALVSCAGFTATPDLAARIEVKAAKLRRHHAAPVQNLHLNLRREKPHTGPARFLGTASVHSNSRDIVVHAESDEPDVLANELFAKLERSLHEQTGERKHARHASDAAASA